MINAIIGHVIGDVMGVPYEFLDRCYIKKRPIKGMKHRFFGLKEKFSDDTSTTLATIQSLINTKCVVDYDNIMEEFCYWLRDGKYTTDGKAYGVGISTYNAISTFYCLGEEALNCGQKDAKGNGALMRMLPIVFYLYKKKANDDEIREVTKNMTKITHNSEVNIMGTYMYVKYCLFLLEGNDKKKSYEMIKKLDYSMFSEETIDRYSKILDDDISEFEERHIYSGGSIWETLEAVLWSILTTNDFKSALLKAVNLGGDTDTIGAITGGIAGILYDVPKEWKKEIKGIKYIENLCKEYESMLEAKF